MGFVRKQSLDQRLSNRKFVREYFSALWKVRDGSRIGWREMKFHASTKEELLKMTLQSCPESG